MLTQGLDHVAVITSDSDRLQQFYGDMFGATVESDGEEYPGGPRLTVINIGPSTELNVFEIDGNDQAEHQTPMSAEAVSITSACAPPASTTSTGSGTG